MTNARSSLQSAYKRSTVNNLVQVKHDELAAAVWWMLHVPDPLTPCCTLKRESKASQLQMGTLVWQAEQQCQGHHYSTNYCQNQELPLLALTLSSSGSDTCSSGNCTCMLPSGERMTFQLDQIPDVASSVVMQKPALSPWRKG